MFFCIPGPSLAAKKKQGLGLKLSIENEIFKPRMKISSENENFVRGGMVFFLFMRSSENDFFSIPGPSGEIIQKYRLRKWPISSADFPMTPMERTEHHFGPFWEKDFGAISGGPFFSWPLCFTADKSTTDSRLTTAIANHYPKNLLRLFLGNASGR